MPRKNWVVKNEIICTIFRVNVMFRKKIYSANIFFCPNITKLFYVPLKK